MAGPKAHRGYVPHRGGRNASGKPRVALCLVFTDQPDPNRAGRADMASFV